MSLRFCADVLRLMFGYLIESYWKKWHDFGIKLIFEYVLHIIIALHNDDMAHMRACDRHHEKNGMTSV